MKVVPEKTYSVKEAARYLGVHRCPIYAYIRYLEKPLAFLKIPDKAKRVFKGTDLIAYKKRILLFPFRIQNAEMTSWNTCNRTLPKQTNPKGSSVNSIVTLRIHWTTAIYMADAVLTL